MIKYNWQMKVFIVNEKYLISSKRARYPDTYDGQCIYVAL